MEEHHEISKERSLIGRFLQYRIRSCIGQDGNAWVQIIHQDAEGGNSGSIAIPPESIETVCEILRDVGGLHPATDQHLEMKSLPDDDDRLANRNANERWHRSEEIHLLRMFLEGVKPEEIAILHGRTLVAITARLKQLGIRPNWFIEAGQIQYKENTN